MALARTMYPITVPGLSTVLTAALSQNDTALYVEDLTLFDAADNLVSIKTNSTNWEVCKYTGKTAVSGNAGYLTISRTGIEHLSSASGNAPISFNAGAKAFRGLTNYDVLAIKDNITGHETRLATAESDIDALQAAASSAMDPVTAAIIFG